MAMSGAQSVMTSGTPLMEAWSAVSWAFLPVTCIIVTFLQLAQGSGKKSPYIDHRCNVW